MKVDTFDMVAEPIIPPWTISGERGTMGTELQRTILRGFITDKGIPMNTPFVQEFNFKEHGEFFRGALTLAGIRHTSDFYELLKRYEKIKVTIIRSEKEER